MSIRRMIKAPRPDVRFAAAPGFNPGTTALARSIVRATWERAVEHLRVLVNVEGLDVHRAALNFSRDHVAVTIEALRDHVRQFEGVDAARAVYMHPPEGALWCLVADAVIPVFVVEGTAPAQEPEPESEPTRPRKRRRRRRRGGSRGVGGRAAEVSRG